MLSKTHFIGTAVAAGIPWTFRKCVLATSYLYRSLNDLVLNPGIKPDTAEML